MANPQDPKPASQPVAQDDVLGEAARHTGPGSRGPTADPMKGIGTPDGPGSADARRDEGEAPPGKDENQAGFLKDKDKRFSP